MNEVLLETNLLRKNFKKGKLVIPVLKGVSFSLKRGETVAIMGASGAGKSTLLQIMGTLDEPSDGKVFFHDKTQRLDLFSVPEVERCRFRNRHMGFVFQFHHLLPEFDALENVMMPGLIARRDDKQLRELGTKWLSEVGLGHRLNHRPSELSGGECQRVALARALFMSPDILFGDELTGNLDSENSSQMIDLLLNLNQKKGVSLILVTHDHKVAQKMSRIVEMKDGLLCQ